MRTSLAALALSNRLPGGREVLHTLRKRSRNRLPCSLWGGHLWPQRGARGGAWRCVGARRRDVHGRRWPRDSLECAISIVGTPLQEQQKIADSPTLAEKDFLARGEDNDARWVAAYVRDSREWLYDWLTDLGVSFQGLARPAAIPSAGFT